MMCSSSGVVLLTINLRVLVGLFAGERKLCLDVIWHVELSGRLVVLKSGVVVVSVEARDGCLEFHS